jgi:hypothetical protein
MLHLLEGLPQRSEPDSPENLFAFLGTGSTLTPTIHIPLTRRKKHLDARQVSIKHKSPIGLPMLVGEAKFGHHDPLHQLREVTPMQWIFPGDQQRLA